MLESIPETDIQRKEQLNNLFTVAVADKWVCDSCGHAHRSSNQDEIHGLGLMVTVGPGPGPDRPLFEYFESQFTNTVEARCENPMCQLLGEAQQQTRRTTLVRAPEYLTIHCQHVDPETGDKKRSEVGVPEWLDLSQFQDERCSNDRLIYQLISVVYHSGWTSHGGHYTGKFVSPAGPHFVDDESIVRCSKSDLETTEVPDLGSGIHSPYILTYVQVPRQSSC